MDVDNGTIACSESDPIIDLYPKNTIASGSMGGVGKGVSTVCYHPSFMIYSWRRRWVWICLVSVVPFLL